MKRTWTWIDERMAELSTSAVEAQCNALMQQWNELEAERGVYSRSEYCDDSWEVLREAAAEVAAERGFAEGSREYEDFIDSYVDEELNAFDERANAPLERQRVIEIMLAAVGARLARPYEHWNEEERMVQYLEEDRWL